MQNATRGEAGQHGLPTAVVLNVSLAGLAAVRSLGREGIPVVGLDPDPHHSGFTSRFGTFRQCPHPVHAPEQLAEFLVDLGRQLDRPGVLSPASDAFVLFISRYREALEPWFRFSLPPAEVMEAAVNKRKLYELAGRVGYAHAKTHYPSSMNDVLQIRDEIDYPVFLKPYYSHMWQVNFPGMGKGIKAHNPDELVAAFEKILPSGVEVMVQSIIQGGAGNVRTVYMHIAQDGTPLGVVTTRKIRQYPVEFGRGSIAETFHDPEFAELGLEFFRRIGYRGFGTIEFKLDDRDGVQKVTDLNPRWVKPTTLPMTAGVNFPLMHYRELAGEPVEPASGLTDFRPGVGWLDAKGDVPSAVSALRARECSLADVGRSWLSARAFPAFAWDDPRPFFKEYDYGRTLLRAPLRAVRRR